MRPKIFRNLSVGEGTVLELDSQQAFRIFLITGLPQAYTYSRAIKREEERKAPKPRRD